MDVGIKPAGTASVTATVVPLVGPVPPLWTVSVYVAPVCPCVKLPLWAEAMLRLGRPLKLPVTDRGAVIVRFWLGVVPLKAPVKYAKTYPAAGLAVTATLVPAL